MDAAADFAAAKALLTRPLPAYVSYDARLHVKFDAIRHDEAEFVVVRTRDGKIVKGTHRAQAPFLESYAHVGGDDRVADNRLGNIAFVPHCYAATGARMQTLDTASVEAITLHDACGDGNSAGFDTLYVDPATKRPIAATGTRSGDSRVAVKLEQRFDATSGFVVPSSLYVRVKGSGMMAWLDVLFDNRYDAYRFDASAP